MKGVHNWPLENVENAVRYLQSQGYDRVGVIGSSFGSNMALSAAACGADGLIIEVHNDPIHALCDGAQSLRPEEYAELVKKVEAVRAAIK